MGSPIISQGELSSHSLKGKTVLITGGGGGIGFETARAIIWLGGNVIIAEIDKEKGKRAEKRISDEFGRERISFFHCDISKEKDICKLDSFISKKYGCLDVIVNNATIAPLGEVHKVDIKSWDRSYEVNLRATVLLVRRFLPKMINKDCGVIVFVPSSGAAPYMGAYEVFKSAQVELCNTLAAELENTNIITYCIGPGFVKTKTALEATSLISQLMGITVDEFFKLNDRHTIGVEAAGAGFAASIVHAERYNGQEIGSIQALMDAKIVVDKKEEETTLALNENSKVKLKEAFECVAKTYNEQYKGWLNRNIFERQWVIRDFKKETGLSTEQMKKEIENSIDIIKSDKWCNLSNSLTIVRNLKGYYNHQLKLLISYEKDTIKLKENTEIISGWIEKLETIIDIFDSNSKADH